MASNIDLLKIVNCPKRSLKSIVCHTNCLFKLKNFLKNIIFKLSWRDLSTKSIVTLFVLLLYLNLIKRLKLCKFSKK